MESDGASAKASISFEIMFYMLLPINLDQLGLQVNHDIIFVSYWAKGKLLKRHCIMLFWTVGVEIRWTSICGGQLMEGIEMKTGEFSVPVIARDF